MEMKTRATIIVLALVQAVIGFEWLRAGWEKVDNPNFVAGMGKTIGAFASKNPTSWYKDFLTTFAAPNATVLGWLVAYGELLAGIALLVAAALYVLNIQQYPVFGAVTSAVALAALVGGAFMSINFWFAAGWLSVSTDGLNLQMFLIQVVLGGATIALLAGEGEKETVDEFEFAPTRPLTRVTA
jgi:uncharacterized membrane protein YphA (DoxX/SURF4 family)